VVRELGKLSAVAVRTQKKPGLYNDGGGLYLQVTERGAKNWVFRFMLNGRRRDMGLGAVHTISLSEAREEARRCRQSVRDAIDPIEKRKAERLAARVAAVPAMTFKQCAEAYIRAYEAGWKNDKHAAQWTATLTAYAYPTLGNLPVKGVDTGLVMKVLDPIWVAKTETASRVRGRIEAILDWATVRKYRDGENPARWKGNLDKLLPARNKVQKPEHHTALPYDRMPEFMKDLRGQEGVAARALEFAILTAARTGEVLAASWQEFDLDKRLWTIPAERMKAGREHRVPLSDATLAILRRMQELGDPAHVFPGARKNRPLSSMALLMVLRRMKRGELTAHGFRSTFRDWAAEQTTFPAEVAEMALAHAVGSKVEAAYRRGDLFEKRQAIMDEWSAYCS